MRLCVDLLLSILSTLDLCVYIVIYFIVTVRFVQRAISNFGDMILLTPTFCNWQRELSRWGIFKKGDGPFSPGLFKGMVKAGASAVKVRSELVKGGPATDYDLDESMMSLEDLEVHYFWRYF